MVEIDNLCGYNIVQDDGVLFVDVETVRKDSPATPPAASC